MAERFQKTYISAREFVSSWEKEVYELNNLDYFIFLLINDLGSVIEKEFFSEPAHVTRLYLGSEDIGTLAFNIGDSLQMFLEKNCFGACSLGCPGKMDEELSIDEKTERKSFISELNLKPGDCSLKEQCLHSDILNYVVLDSLVDYYNYELNLILDEADSELIEFAEFLMTIILGFIRNKGQHLLSKPDDNAGDMFSDLLQSDENIWEDLLSDYDEEDEEEEIEPWKIGVPNIPSIIGDFREGYEDQYGAVIELKLLEKFETYLTDYLEIKRVEEMNIDDLEEFFLIFMEHEVVVDDRIDIKNVRMLFSRFIHFLEYNDHVNMSGLFKRFMDDNFSDIERVLKITRGYQRDYPFMDFLLSDENQDLNQVEGFYEITEIFNGDYVAKDLHLKSIFKNINPAGLAKYDIRVGDVLHLYMIRTDQGWRLTYLEMAYAKRAALYIF